MPCDPELIRKDFPQLDGVTNHYLDSAASSLTPQCVLDAVIDYYTHCRANVHRGIFKEAVRATELYEETREKVARFLNADSRELMFTSGATESSNMLIRMIDESLRFEDGDTEIVTSVLEHHAAYLPLLKYAERKGLSLTSIPLHRAGEHGDVSIDLTEAERLITGKTALVSVMLASNVTGGVSDVRAIARIAHRHGALMIVDATAAVGHIPVDVKALECDALYFSGHKMLAPTGVGVLWVTKDLLARLSPVSFGGHMIARIADGKAEWAEIPTRFEAGTKNIAGVIGLGRAIDYLNTIGVQEIHTYVSLLVARTINALEAIPGVRVIAEHTVDRNVGIVGFCAEWSHPHDIADILARDHVAVRAGHHCAIPLHDALGVPATVRASFHCYNTNADVDALVEGVKKSREIFA